MLYTDEQPIFKASAQYFDGNVIIRQDSDVNRLCRPVEINIKNPATLHSKLRKEIKYDMSFLKMAKEWSYNSYAVRKKVGCLIVRDNNIISDGFNGMPSNMDNSCEDENGETKWEVLHAESNALMKLTKTNQSAEGSTLYITFSPCKNCAKLIYQAGVKRIVYTERHSDTEALEFLGKMGIKLSKYFIG